MKSRFVNPHVGHLHRRLRDVIKWRLGGYEKRHHRPVAPLGFAYPKPASQVDVVAPTVQWMGHSSFLIQVDGIHFLTDPVWSKRCSPIPFIGPKRRHLPPVGLTDLPKIDYVLISHDHYDHLDLETVRTLNTIYPEITWVVPENVKPWFRKQGITHVVELSWWEEATFHHDIKITAVPAQHFSGRSLFKFNTTLWAGYVVELIKHGKKFYFVGDTGYNPHDFKQIGAKWKGFDLCLIPIGAYLPRAFMAPVHVNPDEAVEIHKEVQSKLSIGMHWKTFHLADEALYQPPYDLLLKMQEEKLDPLTFLALEPGDATNW